MTKTMKVTLKPSYRAIDPEHEHALTLGKTYVVIGIEADDFRIIDDDGEPVLFPPDLFTVVDPEEPEDWVTQYGEEGERYAYPPSIGRVGFFEDYFDSVEEVVDVFRSYIERLEKEG